MSGDQQDQLLALAGIFQSVNAVQQIAHRGACSERSSGSVIASVFITNPGTTLEVYGGLENLREGLETLSRVMKEQKQPADLEILRYAMNLIYLAGKVRKNSPMLTELSRRIEQARHTAEHFGFNHPNLIANLASIYADTISTFRLRVQVTGDPSILQVEDNAARVRALLLAGIRSAILWQQNGGRRYHLIFRRGKIVAEARDLALQASLPSSSRNTGG